METPVRVALFLLSIGMILDVVEHIILRSKIRSMEEENRKLETQIKDLTAWVAEIEMELES